MSKLLTNALTRKKWIVEGLVQKASQSFWAAYTGNSSDSIIYQSTNMNAKDGHTTTFDYRGQLSGKAIKGKEQAFGKGEQKKRFSSTLQMERYRIPVDNGDRFDGVDSGNLEISQHSDSRAMLGDLYVRFKDQNIFDCVQGNLKSNINGTVMTPTHKIVLAGHTYNDLLDIEKTIKTSSGFALGFDKARRPLQPFKLANGEAIWLYVVDAPTAFLIKKDPNYQTLMSRADVKGNKNRVIQGMIGRIGALIIVEASTFFGSTETTGGTWGIEDTGVEIAGMRTKDGNGLWLGQEGYDPASGLVSNNVVLGAGAVQQGFGMMPDYRWKSSEDFDITSESALEVWMNVQKTKLIAENEDYTAAKVTDLDWGVITVEVTHP